MKSMVFALVLGFMATIQNYSKVVNATSLEIVEPDEAVMISSSHRSLEATSAEAAGNIAQAATPVAPAATASEETDGEAGAAAAEGEAETESAGAEAEGGAEGEAAESAEPEAPPEETEEERE